MIGYFGQTYFGGSPQVATSTSTTLTVADALHAHTAGNVVLTAVHYLTMQGGLHGHTAGNVTLTQVHVLTVQNALHGHTADQITLSGDFVVAARPWQRRTRNANRNSSRWIYVQ